MFAGDLRLRNLFAAISFEEGRRKRRKRCSGPESAIACMKHFIARWKFSRAGMKYKWILDVLADLKTFSTANGLHGLAKELDDTRLLAAIEIASVQANDESEEKPQSSTRRLQ